MRILIVDDEEIALNSVRRILKWRGIKDVSICDNGADAINRIKEGKFDIVLLDLLMPDIDGLQVLESTKPFCPQTEFIILTAVDDIPTAVKSIRLGGYDYLVKPVENELLFLSIERAYERKSLLAGLSASTGNENSEIPAAFSETVADSPQMKAIISYAHVMARSGNPILITGESGTGKELMARGIHRAGGRPEGPFVAVNCSAIPATMFESQCFGHVKGAFTGAENSHRGYFEQADGGTLFLDEIGELTVGLQAKLLRVLEEKSLVPLGAAKPVKVDFRLTSATNSNLDKACREGRFRVDLLYRIKTAHVHLPPLRERRDDIPLLAIHFLRKSCQRHGKDIVGFSPEAMDVLTQADYAGNIRELMQLVENAVLISEAKIIFPHHLGTTTPSPSLFTRRLCSFRENYDVHLIYVLAQTKGDHRQAAQILGVTLRQLQRKLAEMKKNPRWSGILCDL